MEKSKFDIRRTVEVEQLGKITASQGTLNAISIALSEASKMDYLIGYYTTADLKKRQSDQIYKELKKYNFY